MKRIILLCLVCLFALEALPAGADGNRPVLITAYRQVGWGDAVQIGYVDEAGGLWFAKGQDAKLEWPHDEKDQLAWLETAKGFELLGTLGQEDKFALDSLIACVEEQGAEGMSAACDAGTESSYAVRYTGDGAETVSLGMSGDFCYENADPAAQTLYLFLRGAFPEVTSYFGHENMGPKGFEPVSLTAFCGYEGAELSGARVFKREIDCEQSTEPVELSAEEAQTVLSEILRARVLGKQSGIVTTGGSIVYVFEDASGKQLAAFELYHGLLAMPDGMYWLGE